MVASAAFAVTTLGGSASGPTSGASMMQGNGHVQGNGTDMMGGRAQRHGAAMMGGSMMGASGMREVSTGSGAVCHRSWHGASMVMEDN